MAGARLERQDRGIGHQLYVRPQQLRPVGTQDDGAVHLGQLVQQGRRVVDVDLEPARVEERQVIVVADGDQRARARVKDVVDALAEGGPGRHHLERLDEPGLLAVLQVRDLVPGVLHWAHSTGKRPPFRAVSGPDARSATRIAVPAGFRPRKGAASAPACTLGLDDARNWALLDCVTLDRLGSRRTPAITPAIHTTTISQRNRTSNLAIAANI